MIYRKLIAGPNVQEQAWAWYGLGFVEYFVNNDAHAAVPPLLKAVALYPDFTLTNFFLGNLGFGFGRHEQALSFFLNAKRLLARGTVPDIDKRQLLLRRLSTDGRIATEKGDYGEALRINRTAADAPEYFDNAALARDGYIVGMLD